MKLKKVINFLAVSSCFVLLKVDHKLWPFTLITYVIHGDYMARLIKNCCAVARIHVHNLLKLQHHFAITGSLSICVGLYQGYYLYAYIKKGSYFKLNMLLQDGALNIFITSSCAVINLIVLKKSTRCPSRFDTIWFF